uniref:Putative the eye pigment transporter n=1 Tax=Corethrella appendiculata TaxID=1370023 RepID=U5ERX5_9DIPT
MGTDVAIAIDISTRKSPVELEFINVTYEVKTKKLGKKKLLENVSGKFKPGRLVGILGPSGAGKSSLLNILSGFKQAFVAGTILVNNELVNFQKFRQNSAYISQDVQMLENLSVIESLDFAADLKLSSQTCEMAKRKIVNDIIKILGLEKCTHNMVAKLSGGERKRLSIGLELVTDPQIMFFDEPTSGLDSVAAAQVMHHLKDLALSGRTIVTVVHQPTSNLFQLFDDLYILSNGKCLYRGALDDMVTTFQKNGFECPNFYNRADFAIEVASLDNDPNIEKLFSAFNSDSPVDIISDGSIQNEESAADKLSKNNQAYAQYSTSSWEQLLVLTKRSSLCTIRDLYLTGLRIGTHLFVGLILGVVYYQMGNNAERMPSNTACMLFLQLVLYFSNAMPLVTTFPAETNVLVREYLNNWYSLRSYYFSKIISDTPWLILGPTLCISITYFMTGQPHDAIRFSMFFTVCFLVSWISQLLGFLAGSACTTKIGLFVIPAFVAPLLVFSGFFIRIREMFVFLQPMAYVSFFRHSFEASVHAVYGFNRPNMECNEIFCYFKSFRKFFEYIDMVDNHFYLNVLALFIWVLLLYICLYKSLQYRLKQSRQ